jgi:hypothetical protein
MSHVLAQAWAPVTPVYAYEKGELGSVDVHIDMQQNATFEAPNRPGALLKANLNFFWLNRRAIICSCSLLEKGRRNSPKGFGGQSAAKPRIAFFLFQSRERPIYRKVKKKAFNAFLLRQQTIDAPS